MSDFDYRRRTSREVNIGGIPLGGNNPIRVQSMTNTSTMDTAASVEQCAAIAAAGADYIRLTAQGVREADNLGEIRRLLRQRGVNVPLVADIHFNPKAAFAAAHTVEKVRINPGNFIDPGRTFKKIEFTDEEYAAEIRRIDDTLTPFLELCRKNGTAIRLGVNHGSLSDRIMSRYGDTPEGMVESVMEFLRVCVRRKFYNVVISIKASNVVVMTRTVRLLVREMDREGMDFPLHLGVTEAGDGEDGRIKSALGIGSLLADGIGDTIRVSLSEPPENEIPMGRALVDYISTFASASPIEGKRSADYDECCQCRRTTQRMGPIGGYAVPIVIGHDISDTEASAWPEIDAIQGTEATLTAARKADRLGKPLVITSSHPNFAASTAAAVHALITSGSDTPVIVKHRYENLDREDIVLRASVDLGSLMLKGLADGLWIDTPALGADETASLCLGILQAARRRISKTEYISCPSCGRTLFDLQTTLKEVKVATAHLKGLKIGVMGCIVNGPGEMADADYGYVGAGPGRVTLYKGKSAIIKNIPTTEALPKLIKLIRDNGDWHEPEETA